MKKKKKKQASHLNKKTVFEKSLTTKTHYSVQNYINDKAVLGLVVPYK